MNSKQRALEIHKYYMAFINSEYGGISIPRKQQEEMIEEVEFLIDND